MTIQIRVTPKDVTEGVINSPSSDPVALAMRRAGLVNPIIGRQRVSVQHGAKRVFLELSPELKAFRQKLTYSDRHEVLPRKAKELSFELVIPAAAHAATLPKAA